MLPIHGRLLTSSSSGTAMVSKGMMSVARMTEKSTSFPRQFKKVKAKAASEPSIRARKTVTPVTSTELNMKVAIGARAKAAV
ncbi:hypothetical protein D3C86_1655490 [compost metagenome]